MIDFIGLRRIFFAISLALLVPCLVALALWQLEPGIDFVGGLEVEVEFVQTPEPAEVEAALADLTISDLSVAADDPGTYRVGASLPEEAEATALRTDIIDALTDAVGETRVEQFTADNERLDLLLLFPAAASPEEVRDALADVDLAGGRVQATTAGSFKVRVQEPDDGDIEALRALVEDALRSGVGPLRVLQGASVSGTLSSEIARDAAIAVVMAAIAILIYISVTFRRLPKPAVFGVAAIIALMHDVTIVVGIFSILGRVVEMEVNAMFITALLAVIGYSVNDTIVVFDRVREVHLRQGEGSMRETVNVAVTQTLGRSLNTSITLIVALLALLLIGGVTVRPFVLVLFIGAIAGTYSSIAVASQIVVLWDEGSIQRPFRWLMRRGRSRAAPAATEAGSRV